MGRIKNSSTANGTSGSPQMSLEQERLKNDMAQAEQDLIQSENKVLFAELDKNNVKYTKENVVFIARDETGQIVFLETGNSTAGLKHILQRHSQNFRDAFNLEASQIPAYLRNVIRYGKVVSNKIVTKNGKQGFERRYNYNGNYYVITGIGLNGFVVSAYPSKINRGE